MRKSIFEIENRMDINKEFNRLTESLFEKSVVFYKNSDYSLYEFFNECIFNKWEYRDTFVDLDEYLEHINVNLYNECISQESFLNFLELLLNLMKTAKDKINFNCVYFGSLKVQNIIEHNIPLILEKMNYEQFYENGTIRIRKRDADIDSVLEVVPENISNLLLSYNDIRNNNIENKKTILKKIDLFIDNNEKEYKSLDSKLVDAIGTIVNKMGINHLSKEKPFCDINNEDLNIWYDKCFKMMIHLIREKEIIKIKKERNKLLNIKSEV